jgi:cystathionine beta-synthase
VFYEMIQTNDREAFTMARRLVREEGLFCGGSSGAVVHAALKIAQREGPGKKIVVVLTDSGTRYITKHLSDAWMRDHGMLSTVDEMGFVEDLLVARGKREIFTIPGHESVGLAITQLRDRGVSQLPVLDEQGKPTAIVHELDVLRALQDGSVNTDTPVNVIAQEISGVTTPRARIEELFKIFDADQVAMIMDGDTLVGIVSKIDVIDFISRRTTNGGLS